MSAPVKPTYSQSFLTTSLLLLLSLVTAPISFTISIIVWFAHARKVRPSNSNSSKNRNTTVLITGARTTKSLVLARIFWKAGYRVVIADEAEWGWLSSARFSRCISAYYNLPDPVKSGHDAYESTVAQVIRKENVGLWIPASSAGNTMNDAFTARTLKKTMGKECKFFIQSPQEALRLHDKDMFGQLCMELGFKTPESRLVSDIDEAVEFLHSGERNVRKYIVKCTALDDQGRSDLTQLPFESEAKTRAHLNKMPRRISKESPYVLQQFIPGFEFCTHCHAVEGVMQSFVSCPSSDMLMRYIDCKTSFSQSIAEDAEEWTREFLLRWKRALKQEKREEEDEICLSGHFSFDFIVDSDGTLYPIECNPRVHTAIVLLSTYDSDKLADSYFGKKENGLIVADEIAQHRYSWIFHALPLALGCYLLPKHWRLKLHPLLSSSIDIDPLKTSVPAITISPPVRSHLSEIIDSYISGSEKDPMLDPADPFPFAFQHLTWMWLLGRLVYVQGKGWSRVNVSTSRLFSC